jgi:transposase
MDEMKAKALGDMNEIRRLQDELAEVKKENDFLKKLAAFYAKETK